MKKLIIQSLFTTLFITSAAPAHAAEGKLDKDLIRRVVRAHIPEIRACYNQALARDPNAAGNIVIDFTIGEQGRVTSTAVGSSDFEDAAVPQCMRTAIGGWLFPKPEGGAVDVSYPFLLEPG